MFVGMMIPRCDEFNRREMKEFIPTQNEDYRWFI